ncbi:MAG: hypothetical protein HY717_02765 [Planctomycetes bacterium]|nr:hypothetical protein [Planctomycetota bacterium]
MTWLRRLAAAAGQEPSGHGIGSGKGSTCFLFVLQTLEHLFRLETISCRSPAGANDGGEVDSNDPMVTLG